MWRSVRPTHRTPHWVRPTQPTPHWGAWDGTRDARYERRFSPAGRPGAAGQLPSEVRDRGAERVRRGHCGDVAVRADKHDVTAAGLEPRAQLIVHVFDDDGVP